MRETIAVENGRYRQRDLARRWKMSERTLERWRWRGEGPKFLKIGGIVIYRIEDIEAYEQEQLRRSTADTGSHK